MLALVNPPLRWVGDIAYGLLQYLNVAEFTLASQGVDHYDISLVDGMFLALLETLLIPKFATALPLITHCDETNEA